MQPHLETIYDASMAAGEQAKGFHSLEQAPVSLGVMSTIGPSRMVDFMTRLQDEIPNLDLTLREAKGQDLVDALLEGEDYLLRLHCEFMDHFAALGHEDELNTNIRYRSEREDWVQAMVLA